jgi:hypothetical protein
MSFIAQSVEITLKDIYGIYDFGFIGNDYDEIWDSLKVPSDFNVEKDEFKSKIDSQLSIVLLNHIRNRRNRLLFECDWTQTVDCVLTNKEDWKIYRQALRDLPSNSNPTLDVSGNITNVLWPTKPS